MFLEFAETKTEVGDLNEEQLSVVKPRKICHQFYSVISIKMQLFFPFYGGQVPFLPPNWDTFLWSVPSIKEALGGSAGAGVWSTYSRWEDSNAFHQTEHECIFILLSHMRTTGWKSLLHTPDPSLGALCFLLKEAPVYIVFHCSRSPTKARRGYVRVTAGMKSPRANIILTVVQSRWDTG